MSSITSNKRDFFINRIDTSEYYDFQIDNGIDVEEKYEELYNKQDKNYVLNDSFFIRNYITPISSDIEILNSGINDLDNGSLLLNYGDLTNKEYLEKIKSYIDVLHKDYINLKKVSTNNKKYAEQLNNIAIDEEGAIDFNGGFYQGVFAINDNDNLLKYVTNNQDFTLELALNPNFRLYANNVINQEYNNEGTFFFLGLRSESKIVNKLLNTPQTEGDNVYKEEESCEYFEIDNNNDTECEDGCEEQEVFVLEDLSDIYPDFIITDEELEDLSDLIFGEGIIEEDIELNTIDVTENIGEDEMFGKVEIKTDNKHILFDRSCDGQGYTANSWEKSGADKVQHSILINEAENDNKFLTFNRSCENPYMVKDHKRSKLNFNKDFDFYKDVTNNLFSLIANKDGSISYKYVISSCEGESKYEIKVGTSKPNIVKEGEFNNVKVVFRHDTSNGDGNCKNTRSKGFKIMIFVNGYLKYVSDYLPKFNFRNYNLPMNYQSKLGYNISIGGGTLGLSNTIDITDPTKVNTERYFIDEHFNGVYIGKMKDIYIYPNYR